MAIIIKQRKGIMKIVLVLLLCICVCCILGGCGKLELPEEPKIAADMFEHYSSEWYSRETQTEYWAVWQRSICLDKINDISVIETDLNQKDKTAYVKCIITAGTDDLEVAFSKIDTWELFYSFQEGRWNLTQKNCLETQYELLSDLTEETCAFLLNGGVTFIEEVNSVLNGGDRIIEEYIFQSVTTDRSAKSAVAVYRHISSPTFDEAKFIWTPEIGWSIDDEIASGTCGDNSTWTLNSDGLMTISGKGPMEPIKFGPDYHDIITKVTKVVIEDGITSIGSFAFDQYNNMTSVIIPDSVTSIGDYAFFNCYSLTSVTIPNSVISIGDYAFGSCIGLTSINVASGNPAYIIVDGVLFNADQTFLHTYPAGKNNSSYSIPDSVTSIGDCAFNCGSLTNVTIPNSVTSIGDSAFALCSNLTSVTIPDSVTSIGYGAFARCSNLTSVTIPDSVTSIGEFTFCACDSLTSVTIPRGITSIGYGAFSFCDSLESVSIPDSVTNIEDYAFGICNSLTDVYYAGNEAQWDQITIGNSDNDPLLNATIHYSS